jgi:hypothetical protein
MAEIDNSTGEQPVEPKPDEMNGFHCEGHLKIFDPETEEVFVSARA